MKAVVLSTVFPSPVRPLHGLFVRERILHVAAQADVRVLAPVPWFGGRGHVPAEERQESLTVRHPTFYYVPGVLKRHDGRFLYLSLRNEVAVLLTTFGPDLFDAHFAYPEGFAAAMLGHHFRRPVVITMRGSELAFAKEPGRREAIAWALTHATRVIAVSRELADLAVSLGVPASQVHVIPNGVDTERFTLRPQGPARTQLGLPTADPLFVCVGHLVPLKGFHRVVSAFARIAGTHADARLAIVGGAGAGSRSYPEQLAAFVARLKLNDRVHLVGGQDPDRVATWLNAATALVLDSDREGSPNVVCEALACGCPVVSPKVGNVAEIVTSANGILFDDPTDIEQLYQAMTAALDMSWDRDVIRASISGRTWDAVAASVLDVWHAAAAEKAAGKP